MQFMYDIACLCMWLPRLDGGGATINSHGEREKNLIMKRSHIILYSTLLKIAVHVVGLVFKAPPYSLPYRTRRLQGNNWNTNKGIGCTCIYTRLPGKA